MAQAGVDVLLLSLGADLPWLCGYTAMPLERLTMLVVPPAGADGQPVLVVPELEEARVAPVPDVFTVHAWGENEDAFAVVSDLVRRFAGKAPVLAVSDRAWASTVLRLQEAHPDAAWRPASTVTAPLRAVKDDAEIKALAAAAAAADRVADALLGGEVALVGRTEREISGELTRRLLEEGHDRVNFAIVASGPNSASPHHEAGGRTIAAGDPIVCDFGGSMDGYCSDMTRTVFVGEPSLELTRVYAVVAQAQEAGVQAGKVGEPCCEVDRAARQVIEEAGYGPYFIHRTGHGIGLEEHEDPYMTVDNSAPIVAGHAFSVEPGIYVPGLHGVRIEDIVVAAADGPRSLNRSDHALRVIDA
jgi:Xaa-Pro aminopeptidase